MSKYSEMSARMAELVESIRVTEEIIEGGAREGEHCLAEREYRWHLIDERDKLSKELLIEAKNEQNSK